MAKKERKIHWLDSIIHKEAYWEYGLVWKLACVKTTQDKEPNILATNDASKITCKRCKEEHKKFTESIW